MWEGVTESSSFTDWRKKIWSSRGKVLHMRPTRKQKSTLTCWHGQHCLKLPIMSSRNSHSYWCSYFPNVVLSCKSTLFCIILYMFLHILVSLFLCVFFQNKALEQSGSLNFWNNSTLFKQSAMIDKFIQFYSNSKTSSAKDSAMQVSLTFEIFIYRYIVLRRPNKYSF